MLVDIYFFKKYRYLLYHESSMDKIFILLQQQQIALYSRTYY